MSLTDEQIELHAFNDDPGDWDDLAHRKTWREGYVIGYRAAESAATTPLMERIKELERELEALRKDAADADGMCKALAAVIDKDDTRWKFLHTTNKDAEGFEWCVMRVKWENGRISEAWHTNQDLKDLDAAIDSSINRMEQLHGMA